MHNFKLEREEGGMGAFLYKLNIYRAQSTELYCWILSPGSDGQPGKSSGIIMMMEWRTRKKIRSDKIFELK